MARLRRTNEQHGYFHVWNRGVDRQDIFIDDSDRRIFVELLGEAAERFDVEVHAFSLMSNHFHLVVNCPEGGLSPFAQRLQKRYVERHNQHVDRIGHLFSGRFSSTSLNHESNQRADGDDVLMVMVRYVHRNPLDRMPRRQLEFDPFSSYGVYVAGRESPDWLRTDVVLSLHGGRDRLRAFTERRHPSDKTPVNGTVVEPYAIDDVLRCVREEFEPGGGPVLDPRPHRGHPIRDLAAHLCSFLRVDSTEAIAVAFGVSPRSLRRAAARGKDRCGADPIWASHRRSVLDRLWRHHLEDASESTRLSVGVRTERTG